jgi:archaellum component FlaC
MKTPCKIYGKSTRIEVYTVLVETYEEDNGINFGKIVDNFGKIVDNFGKIVDNFAGIEDNFAGIEDNFAGIEDNFAGIEDNFAEVEDNFVRVEDNFVRIEDNLAEVEDNFTEVEDNFARIEDNFAKVEDNFVRVGLNENSVDTHNRQRGYKSLLFYTLFKTSVMNKNINESLTKIVCIWEKKVSNNEYHIRWYFARKASKKIVKLINKEIIFKMKKNYA